MLTLEEYAAIVEHAPVMIWRADASGSCDYFNDRWLQFRGRSLDQEKGDGWSEGVHSEDLPECLKTWRASCTDHTNFEMEYRMLRHDGEYCWVHDAGAAVYDAAGRFAGFIGSCIALEGARLELKNLRGVLSLCSWCYRIQEKDGRWQQIDRYLAAHSSIGFTHGICPDCASKQDLEADAAGQ